MDDLISRQAAIRIAEQGQVQGYEWQFKKLCELPSAQPQKGKISYTDFCEELWGQSSICSLCGCSWQIAEDGNDNFCPNCGADMRSEAREYLEYGKLIAKGIAQGLGGDSDDNH